MSCPYSDEKLQEWDGVANPMGPPCSECYECECEHWANCPGDCEDETRASHDCKLLYPEIDPYETIVP